MKSQLCIKPPEIFSDASIAERILDAFPSGSYALSALLRLMDIVETSEVPTAAVECKEQPRLLINPEFVEKHAQTPEKLLCLIMHELHHVLLGHTTLFPRHSAVQNFVFDAVINGLVCRMFPGDEYSSFFTDYYDAESFPQCLLRPPKGWSDSPESAQPTGVLVSVNDSNPGSLAMLPEADRQLINEVHQALYSETGASYHEVYKILPRLLDEPSIKNIPLLGGHQEGNSSDLPLEAVSPVLFDVVRSVVEQWPQPPDPIKGRSLADFLQEKIIKPVRQKTPREVIRGLILKVADKDINGGFKKISVAPVQWTTPIPQLDRRSVVMRHLGFEPLLFNASTHQTTRTYRGEKVHVYLDVSASMDNIKPALYGAVIDCEAYVHRSVHLFSNKVADISFEELKRGVCKSTYGTSIECVAEHIQKNRIKRALMITDGWVGKPNGEHLRILERVKLAVAYIGKDTSEMDLENVSNHIARISLKDQKS